MTNDRPSGWQGWISLLALLPLALASARLLPVTALPVAATGAAALALDALSRRTWAERAAALEAAALVSVGTLAGYATAVGVRPPLDVPALLAGSLLLGSTVVAWAVDKALPGHGAPASAQLATWLSTPQWNRAMALLLVILGVCLVKGAWAFGSAVPYTWLVASYSYLPLVPLCVLCLPAGRVARPTTVLALMAVLVMAVWDFASTEVVLALDEPLTWPDLMVRFEDPSSFRILAEGLRSWSALLLVLGVFGGVAGLSRLLVRLRPAALGWTLARVVGLVLFSGRLLIQGQTVIEPRLAARYLTAASAPWSPVHTPPQYDRQIDMAVAREVRRALEPPLWEEGPALGGAGTARIAPGERRGRLGRGVVVSPAGIPSIV
jgi:hypothetical protein